MKSMEKGSVYAFINFKQAAGLGHVAWGFQLDQNLYRYGSADHLWRLDWWDLAAWLRYMHVAPGGDIDWWHEDGTRDDMLSAMKTGYGKDGRRHIFYHAYKQLDCELFSAPRAVEFTAEIERQGWHVFNQNCVQQAQRIFLKYSNEYLGSSGNSLPDPFSNPLNLIPKTWFARIPSDPFSL